MLDFVKEPANRGPGTWPPSTGPTQSRVGWMGSWVLHREGGALYRDMHHVFPKCPESEDKDLCTAQRCAELQQRVLHLNAKISQKKSLYPKPNRGLVIKYTRLMQK